MIPRFPPAPLRGRALRPGSEGRVDVEVTAARGGLAGTLQLEAPQDGRSGPRPAVPAGAAGERANSRSPSGPVRTRIGRLTAEPAGATGPERRIVIRHDHIPAAAPAAGAAEGRGPRPRHPGRASATSPVPATAGREPGGDGLRGHPADRRGPDAREARHLDAVVIGVRAFNVATISPPTCRRSSATSKPAGRSSLSTTGRAGSRRPPRPL